MEFVVRERRRSSDQSCNALNVCENSSFVDIAWTVVCPCSGRGARCQFQAERFICSGDPAPEHAVNRGVPDTSARLKIFLARWPVTNFLSHASNLVKHEPQWPLKLSCFMQTIVLASCHHLTIVMAIVEAVLVLVVNDFIRLKVASKFLSCQNTMKQAAFAIDADLFVALRHEADYTLSRGLFP